MGYKDRPYYQDDTGGIPPVSFRLPKVTRLTMTLIVTCLVLFLAQSFGGSWLTRAGELTFRNALGFTQPWRWVTYQYLHGDAFHFLFNMLGLYFFLPTLELLWGWKKAFAFYTAGGIAGGVLFGLLAALTPGGGANSLIGASGSILATLGAVALLFPDRTIVLLFFPLPIRTAAALLGALFLLLTIADRNLSGAAHLGGLAFGFFSPYLGGPVWRRSLRKFEQRQAERASRAEQDEQATIDRILEKVHTSGMNSLSGSERRTLKRATERQRQADAERARRRAAR